MNLSYDILYLEQDGFRDDKGAPIHVSLNVLCLYKRDEVFSILIEQFITLFPRHSTGHGIIDLTLISLTLIDI